ncbi:unnamed protein product [Ixodes hexagonus]
MKSAFKERQLSEYSSASQRPKRNASAKGLGSSNGLHWMEEKQLKKALYASLNETKKVRLLDENVSEDSREQTPKTVSNSSISKKTSDAESKRIKVHAQRKFAQGSNPSSPMPTPVKMIPTVREAREPVGPPSTLLPCKRRPKTEDFLTFLCLRGTSALPPSLDFMSGAGCSGTSSERSSSPDGDSRLAPASDAKETSKGANGSSTMTSSTDTRSSAQRLQRSSQRCPRNDSAEDPRSTHDPCIGRPVAAKQRTDKKKTVLEKTAKNTRVPSRPKDSRKNSTPPKLASRRSISLAALKAKYKKQRLFQKAAQPSGGGHVLRSRTVRESVKPSAKSSRDATKSSNVTPKRPSDTREEEFSKEKIILKKQLSVRLTRLSPRLAASVRAHPSGVPSRRPTTRGSLARGGITPHIRKAKLVPPIVDYDSDSERDVSPLSPQTRNFVFFGKTAVEKVPEKTLGGRQGPRRTKVQMAPPAKKRQSKSAEIAKKLLSTAKGHVAPRKAGRNTLATAFRRETRSLGPVKEYPLVLALPTKRGSGRFGSTYLKKHVQKTHDLPGRRQAPRLSPGKGAGLRNPSLKRSFVLTRLVSKKAATEQKEKKTRSKPGLKAENVPHTRRPLDIRRRSETAVATTSGARRCTRRAYSASTDNTPKGIPPKRRTVPLGSKGAGVAAVRQASFSDSDDEPLINLANRANLLGKLYIQKKVEVTVPKTPVTPKTPIATKRKTSLASIAPVEVKRRASIGRRKLKVENSKVNLVKAELASQRFSEPSPSSLSETIADAAGNPLDPPADLHDLDSMSGGVEVFDALAGEISQVMSCRLSFGSAQEIRSLMTSEFSGAFDENVTAAGAMLLGSREGTSTSLEAGLNLIKREDVPTKATVGTNTSDVDLLSDSFAGLNSSDDYALPEEMSVSTQTERPHSLNCRRDISVFRKPSAKNEPTATSTPAPKGKGSSRKSRGPLEDLKKVKLTPQHTKKFPGERDPACLVVAPTYRPTAEEIKDPIGYISKIRAEAEKFGICRIILPSSFQPECKVFDEMRFTAHNQFIHQMFSRWGPNVKHTACIKRCFMKQGITDDQPPLIGGIEVDLSHLYHTVQSFGGIQQVMEKKKWQRVADAMHIPRAAQDRVSKVDDAYCKFVLPYDLLSPEEKANVEKEVEADHEQQLAAENDASAASAEEELEEEFGNECVTKGRTMSLSVFQRVARNTMSMWYKQDPSDEDVEKDYWGMVIDQKRHVCVHAGNIDSSVHGSGFPTNRVIPFAKHPWNLKVFTNNPGTVLRCMGPVSGVTIPTLHLSMLFTTGCWYRDPHCLPWIEYLHTGANKIWYSVPAQSSQRFHTAMKDIMPQVCKDSVIWLPSDCAMVPPALLVENGCPLSRTVQEKGQFVVIFPGAFTSTIACGYSVSESVYFATKDWLLTASQCFQHIKASCEPPTFSLEKLLLGIGTDLKEDLETCQRTLPLLRRMCDEEQRYRRQLSDLGLKTFERVPKEEVVDRKKVKRPRLRNEENEQGCETCRISCHVSMVVNIHDDTIYCLEHAVQSLQKRNLKSWKLLYSYDMDELRSIVQKLESHIENQKASDVKAQAEPTKKKSLKKK